VDAAEIRRRAESAARVIQEAPEYAHTRNVVVTRYGEPPVERQLGAGNLDDPVDTYSITKSVVSTLAGIALDRGAIGSLDDPVAAYLGDRVRHPYTVRHLLTMTAGVETDGAWEIDEVMALPSGWVDRILDAPRRREPGAAFAYDNGAAHLLGAARAAAVGMPLSELAAAHLFAPLGIERWEWPRDPDGADYGFGHLKLSPRDLAKLGELYLAGGGEVVSRAYVEEATRPHSAGGGPEGAAYGFLWWTADEPFRHFFAGGYAGQSLTAIPELGVVAVTTGDEALLRPGWRNARHAVLEAFAS
jgi:CubicO group peptidase (beta-lactamase class C family)